MTTETTQAAAELAAKLVNEAGLSEGFASLCIAADFIRADASKNTIAFGRLAVRFLAMEAYVHQIQAIAIDEAREPRNALLDISNLAAAFVPVDPLADAIKRAAVKADIYFGSETFLKALKAQGVVLSMGDAK